MIKIFYFNEHNGKTFHQMKKKIHVSILQNYMEIIDE